MPIYEYLCNECGPFTDMRPMAECDEPNICPECGDEAPRVLLTAPRFSCVSSETRAAHAINERSAHAPKSIAEFKAAHSKGCACCTGKPSRLVQRGKDGSKSFPTSRPWMISH